jgi:hypothetical protein
MGLEVLVDKVLIIEDFVVRVFESKFQQLRLPAHLFCFLFLFPPDNSVFFLDIFENNSLNR